jgi:hypothetical protein
MARASNLVGTALGQRYQVEALLGRGGMAEVYRVHDMRRGTTLAMKILHEDMAQDMVFLRRFSREAQVLAQLQHPNIVRLFSFERFGRLACIFLEFIDGDTLRGRIFDARAPLPLKEIDFWLRPTCIALHYAHEMSIFHCDIKPANIMATRDGRVVLSDFGIARLAEGTATTMSTPGTPAYMAPEQIVGSKLDARTDIYALGITLYEMATGGERPFSGDTDGAVGSQADRIRWQHLYEKPPSPRLYNKRVSESLEAVIIRAISKHPDDRFQNIPNFYRAFIAACQGQTVTIPTAPRPLPDGYRIKPAGVIVSSPAAEPEVEIEEREEPRPPEPVKLRPRPVVYYCVNHPDVETYTRCVRCAATICSKCVRETRLGVLCPTCFKDESVIGRRATIVDWLMATVISFVLTGLAVMPLKLVAKLVLAMPPISFALFFTALVFLSFGGATGWFMAWVLNFTLTPKTARQVHFTVFMSMIIGGSLSLVAFVLPPEHILGLLNGEMPLFDSLVQSLPFVLFIFFMIVMAISRSH